MPALRRASKNGRAPEGLAEGRLAPPHHSLSRAEDLTSDSAIMTKSGFFTPPPIHHGSLLDPSDGHPARTETGDSRIERRW